MELRSRLLSRSSIYHAVETPAMTSFLDAIFRETMERHRPRYGGRGRAVVGKVGEEVTSEGSRGK